MLKPKGMIHLLLLAIIFLVLHPPIFGNTSDAEAGTGLLLDSMTRETGKPGKEALPEGMKKLNGILHAMLQDERQEQDRFMLQQTPARSRLEQLPPGTAYVYVHLHEGAATKVVDSFAWNVDNRNEAAGIAVAWIYLDRLEHLAAREEVRAVRAVLPPVTRAGSVTSEGGTLHRADLARSTFGFDGTGIKVGVISSGVEHWVEAYNSGDLPDLTSTILSDTIDGDEGTAMLEIIHDLAPGAELYFHDHGSNILAFNNAVDALVAQGCQIIIDDVCWKEEPFFEDGIVARHVAQVIAEHNVLYLSAAGNAAASHYQGSYFRDTGEPIEWHDFSHGSGAAKDLYVKIGPGQQVTVVLQWDDPWGASANDYDLFLVTGIQNTRIARSEELQDGTGDPLEVVHYTNEGDSTIDARVWVKKYSGEARTLKVYIYGVPSNPPDNITAAGSIIGHPALPGVLAVGAINANAPNQIAPYSSRGPSFIAFPAPETRNKPELSGIDRVSVSGAGGFPSPFYGTSAAASHVAAVAALAWSAAPGATAAEIRQVLLDTAIDKGSPGFNYTYGYGLADAYSAVEALLEDQCIVITPARPSGSSAGLPGTNYSYTTTGSSCIQGHSVHYRYDWGDGTYSDWDSSNTATKFWGSTGTYAVRAQARCAYDEAVQSGWSPVRTVAISETLEYTPGDVNEDGKVDVGDAILVLRSIVGLTSLEENQFYAADVNGDGNVDVSDAILILRYIVGLISEFPVNED